MAWRPDSSIDSSTEQGDKASCPLAWSSAVGIRKSTMEAEHVAREWWLPGPGCSRGWVCCPPRAFPGSWYRLGLGYLRKMEAGGGVGTDGHMGHQLLALPNGGTEPESGSE